MEACFVILEFTVWLNSLWLILYLSWYWFPCDNDPAAMAILYDAPVERIEIGPDSNDVNFHSEGKTQVTYLSRKFVLIMMFIDNVSSE